MTYEHQIWQVGDLLCGAPPINSQLFKRVVTGNHVTNLKHVSTTTMLWPTNLAG